MIALASKRVQELPPINVIERVCALAITRANRKIYLILAETLSDGHRILSSRLDMLYENYIQQIMIKNMKIVVIGGT